MFPDRQDGNRGNGDCTGLRCVPLPRLFYKPGGLLGFYHHLGANNVQVYLDREGRLAMTEMKRKTWTWQPWRSTGGIERLLRGSERTKKREDTENWIEDKSSSLLTDEGGEQKDVNQHGPLTSPQPTSKSRTALICEGLIQLPKSILSVSPFLDDVNALIQTSAREHKEPGDRARSEPIPSRCWRGGSRASVCAGFDGQPPHLTEPRCS